MRHEHRAGWARDLLWIALPFIAYLVLLQRLWFNAPVGDDYEAVLASSLALMEARSPGEWLATLVSQHNEHRVVVTRVAALTMAEVVGRVDFRVLALFGNLGLAGVIVLMWAEFRGRVRAPLVGAAAFAICQVTHYEGSLLSMAAISNTGVIAFAFASLHFALRPGGTSLALALAFALLAAGSLASGLFVLPIAAAGCALRGDRRRAAIFAAVAIALWILYLSSYHRPPNHPSVLEALRHPLDAMHLFVVLVGSILPGVGPATAAGGVLLALLGWLTLRGFWREHPVAALWIAFLLLSAAAAAAGRVGFGVFHASRYSVNGSCLAAILLLLLAGRRVQSPAVSRALFAVAAIASLGLSYWVWPKALEYSLRGHLLAAAAPAEPGVLSDTYFGVVHPDARYGMDVLAKAHLRGLFRPRPERVYASATRVDPAPLPGAKEFGQIDLVHVAGTQVHALGWTDITAQVPGRVFVSSGADAPRASRVVATSRTDLAAMSPRLVYGGFRWEAEFDSPGQAARAAQALCLQVEAPGVPSRRFVGRNTGCAVAGPAR